MKKFVSLVVMVGFVLIGMTSVLFAQTLELMSRQDAADGGAQGNLDSFRPSISADGRFVGYDSVATNLIPGGGFDINGTDFDVFVFDREDGSLELVSRRDLNNGGAQGNRSSNRPSISANGHFVAFDSLATNLILGGDANGIGEDVFVFDRDDGSLDLVSRQDAADGGAQANMRSFTPSISADGRFITFASSSTNLIPGGGFDINGTDFDIFVFDRNDGSLELVSRQDAADGGAQANNFSQNPAISADGRFVAFESLATNLIPGGGIDINGSTKDIFVFDREDDKLELISRQDEDDGGAQANGFSQNVSISANGRFVAFESSATNLGPNTPGSDVFVFDREDGSLVLVSRQDVDDGGVPGTAQSHNPSISADGRSVAFHSGATNLIPGGGDDINPELDVFVFDREIGSLELLSRQDEGDGGAQANGRSELPSISANGRFVAFMSQATNLIPGGGGGGDVNGTRRDIFVFDRLPGLINDLIDTVINLGLPRGAEEPLINSLESALDKLIDENPRNNGAVVGKLNDLMYIVEAKRSHQIPDVDADELGALVEQVIALLETI